MGNIMFLMSFSTQNLFIQMFCQDGSSSQESEDQNFDQGLCKKVNYVGSISESDSSDQHSEDSYSNHIMTKRVSYQKKISFILKNDQFQEGKTKFIKKNCQSAKKSRQRKKIYLELLEIKQKQLKISILKFKKNIRQNQQKIMSHLTKSNRQKSAYLKQKILLSKKLIKYNKELMPPKESSISTLEEFHQNQMKPSLEVNQQYEVQSQPGESHIVNSSNNKSDEKIKKQQTITKKKYQKKQKLEANYFQERLQLKKELLSASINSFLYQFGPNGGMKNDMIQRAINDWFDTVQSTKVLQQEQIKESAKVFQNSFAQIQRKNKNIDGLLRKLKQKIKQQFVVKFLLEKQFFPIQNKEKHHHSSIQVSQDTSA